MSDKTRNVSQTGQISRAEIEPEFKRENPRSTPREDVPEAKGSATGVMPIYHEPADDSAERDEDKPDE